MMLVLPVADAGARRSGDSAVGVCADPFPHKLIRLCFAKKESTCWQQQNACASCSYLTVQAREIDGRQTTLAGR